MLYASEASIYGRFGYGMAVPVAELSGNVRELENVIQRALILASDRTVHSRDLPLDLHGGAGKEAPTASVDWLGQPLKEVVRAYERRVLQHVIDHFGGDKEEAARRLQISLASLYSKLKESEERES